MKLLVNLASMAVVASFLFVGVPDAGAVLYGFDNITGNSPVNAAAGEAQLSVDVTDPGGGQVLFTFRNIGLLPMSITDVYFDDGTLLGIAQITNMPGFVSFSQGASPPDLPGGNSIAPAFQTTAGFLADSAAPPPINGVNPGETLGITFNLLPGVTFADTIAALNSLSKYSRTGNASERMWLRCSASELN